MYEKILKRVIDFLISFVALIVLLPVLLILTLTGIVAMRGNPFFIQKRPGRIDKNTGEEKIFSLIKFRTMKNLGDENGDLVEDQKRLNRYGKFLRNTSLDELPELINIFKGDMSFVGPRPLLVKYLPLYSEEQRHRHDVRPGLTGYAQAHGRNSITWEEKFIMDVWYTRNISFKTDLKIISDTIKTVLRQEGIDFNSSMKVKEFTGNKND
ncbi:MAG: sugar transferase [Clostridia bacterium]|nr:sugar transferase [Clostridia bacterium]